MEEEREEGKKGSAQLTFDEVVGHPPPASADTAEGSIDSTGGPGYGEVGLDYCDGIISDSLSTSDIELQVVAMTDVTRVAAAHCQAFWKQRRPVETHADFDSAAIIIDTSSLPSISCLIQSRFKLPSFVDTSVPYHQPQLLPSHSGLTPPAISAGRLTNAAFPSRPLDTLPPFRSSTLPPVSPIGRRSSTSQHRNPLQSPIIA